MLAIVLFSLGFVALAVAVALGLVPDTRQPGRLWYPAGPDRRS